MRLTTTDRLNDVYSTLDNILNSPQLFGLEHGVPRALADSLQIMRETLGDVLRELPYEATAGNLEAELSQDADSLCGANG